jgi:hypothetical protein
MVERIKFYARVHVRVHQRVLKDGFRSSKQYYITIPKHIWEALGLEKNEFVEVTIRKVK